MADLLGDQVCLAAGLQGLHVTPAGVVPQHLYVDESDHQLLQKALVQPGILESRLQSFDFLRHYTVLLCLAFALPDGPYERVELPGPCWSFLAQGCEVVHVCSRNARQPSPPCGVLWPHSVAVSLEHKSVATLQGFLQVVYSVSEHGS